MAEQLYAEYPALYDAIQSEYDYDGDVSFVSERLQEHDVTGGRLLEIGCGTGEHTRRLVEAGFDVTAVEPEEGMRSLAREKTAADFRAGGLPDLPVDDEFDVVVAIRGVINHVPPDDLAPSLQELERVLADGGILVFDNASHLPPDGNEVALDVGEASDGDYARIVQMNPTEGDQIRWDSVVFTPGGDFFVDTYRLTPFDDVTIGLALSELGLSVDTVDGFDEADRRTVFVATR